MPVVSGSLGSSSADILGTGKNLSDRLSTPVLYSVGC
jgi:hypothetical protein